MTSALKMTDLSFSYPEIQVLSHVNCTVAEGEFIGIIGPNGGGKTTFLKLILRFLQPSSGTIEIFGDPSPSANHLIGYVPQLLRYDRQFPISVLEVVLMGRLSHLPWHGQFSKRDRDLAHQALEKVGIVSLCQRAFGTLSGGQAQRVLIARALVSEPRLLLLDEPTASIDQQAQAEIYALLNALKGEITILMVTHDLEIAAKYVQRVICIQNTAITLEPKEICEHFALGLYHPR